MERRIADINEMIDIMSSIQGGVFVSLCYMNSAKIGKTLSGKDINVDQFGQDLDNNRIEGDDDIYNNLKNYQQGGVSRKNKFPYGGIVKMSTYQFNWQSEDNYGKNFHNYAKKRDELLAKYGAEIQKRELKHDEKLNFGTGVSVGATDNTKHKLYTHQNGATIRNAKSKYFIVDNDGELKGGVSYEAIKELISKTKNIDGLSALKKIGATEDQIQEYIQDLKALNFRVLKLMFDSILYIVCSVNGEKLVYINNNLAKEVGSGAAVVKINPQSFIEMANELYREDVNDLHESINQYNLFKSKINESVRMIFKNLLSESLNEVSPEYYEKYAKKAQNSVNGLGGNLMKKFNNKKYWKRQHQAKDLQDMSDNHPSDEWEIIGKSQWGNKYDDTDVYTLRNTRTGELETMHSINGIGKRVRGKIVKGKNVGTDYDVRLLNDPHYNPQRR